MRNIQVSLFLFLLVACSDDIPTQGETSTVRFEQLFTQVNGGQYTPKYPIKIGGVSMGEGVQMGGSVQFDGIQLDNLKNKDITVKNINGVMVMQSIN